MQEIARFESRALEELYDRYSPLLYTIIKKIAPDQIKAEKILVEVFVIIWRKIDKFDFKVGNVYSWLETLTRNKAIDILRKVPQVNVDIDGSGLGVGKAVSCSGS